jgi:hypothetical protein
MAVGLHLTGRYPSGGGQAPEDWLDQIAAWIEGHEEEPLMLCRAAENPEGQATLLIQIHPSAEDIELVVSQPGRVSVAASTSSLGAGYHIYLCGLLERVGRQFQITWDEPGADGASNDDTGYFFTHNAEAVRREMRRWLGALARVIAEQALPAEAEVRMVSMPLGYSYPDAGGVATPLGPRPLEWFQALATDEARADEFFAWWEEGIGPAFFRGRALTRMWQDVRWRIPITDDEGEMLMDVHLDLERAFRRDPEGALPWREWYELVQYLNDYFGYVEFAEGDSLEDEIRRRGAAAGDGPPIGYRRERVQVALTGGWSLTIPGELAEEWEPGGQTWSAWYGGRTVWFSSWTVQGGEEGERPAAEILAELELPTEGDHYELCEGAVLGKAVFLQCEEDGQMVWNLRAYSAVDGGFALCNLYVQGQDDLPWAIEVWKTMRH